MKNVLNFNRTPMDVGGMKSTVKNTTRWLITLIAFLTLGVGQMWASTFNYPYIYFDNSYSQWDEPNTKSIAFFLQKNDGNQGWTMSKISGTHLFYLHINDNWSNGNVTYYRFASISYTTSDWGWYGGKDIYNRLENNKDCFGMTALPGDAHVDPSGYLKSALYIGESGSYSNTGAIDLRSQTGNLSYSDLNYTQTIHIMLSDDDGDTYSDITTSGTWRGDISATHTYMSGNGTSTTSSNQALSSSTYTKSAALSSTFTLTESNTASGYAFRGWALDDDGPDDDDATFSIENVRGTNDIYAYFVISPSVSISSVAATTPATPLLGEAITITASRENVSGTPTINYQVKKPGDDSFATVGSSTTTSYAYTPAVSDPIGVYTFRTRMVYNEVEYISGTTETLYVGKMATLKIKDASSWLSNIYLYTSDATPVPLADYPGNTLGTYGSKNGQWWVLSIYSKYNNFIVNETTYKNQSSEMEGWSDGDCYVFNNTWNATLSTGTCPSAPSLTTTSAPSPLTNTSATLLGNISSNGNDAITDYGFYWGTSSANTKAQIATSDHTGDISKAITVTAGTTYKYKAYAINGYTNSAVYGTEYSFVAPYKVTVSKSTGCSSITPSADIYYHTSGFTLTAVAKDGYTFSEWSKTKGDLSNASSSGSTNTVTFTPTADEATITASYSENKSDITISTSTGGSVDAASAEAYSLGVDTKQAINATANAGYYFKQWNVTGNALVDNATNASTYAKSDGTDTGEGSVTAEFPLRYAVIGAVYGTTAAGSGMPGMSDYSKTLEYQAANDFRRTLTLKGNTKYKFRIRDLKPTAQNLGGENEYNVDLNGSHTTFNQTGADVTFTTEGSGDITFKIDGFVGGYPQVRVLCDFSSYAVTIGSGSYYINSTNDNSTTGGNVTAVDGYSYTITNGQKVKDGGSVVFTANPATGYTFAGWYSNSTCTTPITHNGTTIVINDAAKTLTLSNIGEAKTVYAKFVEHSSTVTIRANHTDRGSITVASSPFSWGSSTTVGKTTKKALVITPATGYYLAGWDFSEGADFELQDQSDSEDETVTLAGLGGIDGSTGTLTARFEPLDKIYFRNENAETGEKLWGADSEDVYVYFWAYWTSETLGAGANGKHYRKMTNIEGTNIYWAYVPRVVTKTDASDRSHVAFSSRDWGSSNNFYGGGYGAYRGDYNRILNMYVPQNVQTHYINSGVSYRNKGYWMKYDTKKNEGAGYYWQRFTTSPSKQYIQVAEMVAAEDNATTLKFKITIDNVSNDTYIIKSAGGLKYWPKVGESVQTITSANCTNLNLFEDNGEWPAFEFSPTVKGDYIFTLDQTKDIMKFSVEYPDAPADEDDYRLKHTYTRDAVTYTTYSNVISAAEASTPTTVSMYLSTEGTETLVLQKCTGISEGEPTWDDQDGTNLGSVLTTVGDDKGVYVFNITINTSTHKVSVATTPTLYTGDYYLHANATSRNNLAMGEPKTGSAVGNKFTKFLKNTGLGDTYDYYWVDWFIGTADGGGAQSVAATIGNEYNDDLAGKIAAGQSTTTDGANVRYAYNSETNAFTYQMISGGGSSIKIINTVEAEDVKILVGSDYVDAYNTERSASDADNWMYSFTAQVKPGSTASIKTTYNAVETTLAEDKQLLGGSGLSAYEVEITYDFKTNRLIASWKPSGEITEAIDLESNMMVVRTENSYPTVLNLTGAGALDSITQIYTVMEFGKTTWASSDRTITGGGYTDAYYWISLPYDCNISDIFGIDNYGDWWVIQTYHGDYRAEKGWWAETANWWYNMGRDGVMNANQGYVLRLTNLAEYGAPFYSGGTITKLHLYFPSSNSKKVNVKQLGESKTITLESLECKQWNKNNSEDGYGVGNPEWDRRTIDSNWRLIGAPSFNSTKTESSLSYFYKWSVVEGVGKYTIATTNTAELKATHAYLVQYAGDIKWVPYDENNPLVGVKAPAREKSKNEAQTIRLVLNNENGEQADVTYISRMEEGATKDYDLNLDLSKMINKRSNNIYTKAGHYKMAGNCLPDTEKTVPVGLQLATAGEYTFTLPDGAQGTSIVLVDNETGSRTNLALTDYVVTLGAGIIEGRFVLEMSPIAPVPTDIESVDGNATSDNVRKVMSDGQLYLIQDGVVYDARGNRVQ